MRILYDKKSFIDIEPALVSQMIISGHIVDKNGKYRLNTKHPETEYLFASKLSPPRRKSYLQIAAKNGFVCKDCGKKHSFHVRPTQEKDGSVNFKNMVNVCEDCRMDFLKSKELFSLQFKEQINWNETKKNILREMNEMKISDRNRYFKLSMEIVKVRNFTKIQLPPLKFEGEMREKILEDYRDVISKHLGENIDLESSENRKIVRDYLTAESGGECVVCGSKHTLLTIDHIVAKNLGGSNHISNTIGMCQKCNKIKGHKTVIEFLASVEMNHLPNRVISEALKQQEEARKHLETLTKELDSLVIEDCHEEN